MNKTAYTFSPRDKQLILKYLTGGAALGVGAGLGTSLLNHLRSIKEEGEFNAESASDDDDTLYIKLPPKKAQELSYASDGKKTNPGVQVPTPSMPVSSKSKNTPLAASSAQAHTDYAEKAVAQTSVGTDGLKVATIPGGVALAGSGLAALGGYQLIRKAYRDIKKQRLQEQLDRAQIAYLETLQGNDPEEKQVNTKSAKGMSTAETLTSIPVGGGIILTLAGAVLANELLNKSFPGAQRSKTRVGPRRVVVKTDPRRKEENPDEEAVKTANENDGAEFLFRLVLADSSRARDSQFDQLVKAASAGRVDELTEASRYGLETVFGIVKGATDSGDSERRNLAISWLVNDNLLGPSVKVATAAEFIDMAPSFFQLSQQLDESQKDMLLKVAYTTGEALRHASFEGVDRRLREASNQKSASAMGVAALLRTMLKGEQQEEEPEGQGQEAESLIRPSDSVDHTLLSTDSQDSQPGSIKAKDEDAKSFVTQNKDRIDAILSNSLQETSEET